MLALKPQIDTTPAFMGGVLSLPFDQKFPLSDKIDQYTCESSPSRLRIFVSSTFVPASNRGILFLCRMVILLVVVCFHSSVAIALDPSRRISQYQHTAWRSQDGFVTVAQMTQTTDGYLWLTTPDGLFRLAAWDSCRLRLKGSTFQPGELRLYWDLVMEASGLERRLA